MELMKRAVWCSILQSNAVVTNAEELHQTAQNVCKKIDILFICKRSVSKETVKLRERWECCKAITQAMAYHKSLSLSSTVLRPFLYHLTEVH